MTLAFDFHVEDLWVPLIIGATLIAGKSGTSLFGADLHEFLLSASPFSPAFQRFGRPSSRTSRMSA